jgi:hypothetical protein
MLLNASEIDNFNDANVPVDIWLTKLSEDDVEDLCTGREFDSEDLEKMNSPIWRLKMSNYMPRKGGVDDEGITIYSDSKEELQEIVRKKILPLYRRAVNRLVAISEGKASSLYYWDEPAEQA